MVVIKKEKLLVKPKDIKPSVKGFKVIGTFNPAAARLKNGDIVLYVRVVERLIKDKDKDFYYVPRCSGRKKCNLILDKFPKEEVVSKGSIDIAFKDDTKRLTFISHLRRVILDKTGFKVKKIDKGVSFGGLFWDGELGVEDPRITTMDDGSYVMTYVNLSIDGNISTNYATSKDGMKWKRMGTIFKGQNKNVVIFPEKVKGKYLAFNRPEESFKFSNPHIWLSKSKDLQYWGNHNSVKLSKKGSWDSSRVGPGPPPLKTDKGWLLIYHGVTEHKKHKKSVKDVFDKKSLYSDGVRNKERLIYSAGAALFDLKDPTKLLAKSSGPIIIPTKKYEKGTFENKDVFFPTGLVRDLDGKSVLVFAGAGDVNTIVRKIPLESIFDSLKKVKV